MSLFAIILGFTASAEEHLNTFSVQYHVSKGNQPWEEITIKEKQYSTSIITKYFDRWVLYMSDAESKNPCKEAMSPTGKTSLIVYLDQNPTAAFETKKTDLKTSEFLIYKDEHTQQVVTDKFKKRQFLLSEKNGAIITGKIEITGARKVRDRKTFKYLKEKKQYYLRGSFKANLCE